MTLDHGMLNLHLAKRGDIDRQLDAYKADQKAKAAAKRKADAAAFRESKAAAKVALAELLAATDVLDAKAEKLGVTRKDLVVALTDWSKWEPLKLLVARKQWLPAQGD